MIVHVVKTLELSIPFILQYHHIKPRLNTVFDVLLYSFFFLFSLYMAFISFGCQKDLIATILTLGDVKAEVTYLKKATVF